jgi:hypothetical protein
MTLYNIQQFFLNILDNLTYQRCRACDEIVFDGECDYCNQINYSN